MFDVIVITAANEAQAAGYREQVAWRRANGFFDDRTDVLVVPDPGGRRAKGDPFKKRRILVCHSGGDSRRTPAYAALGKAFAPLPCTTAEGRPLALFDLIVREADRLPAPRDGQLLVLSGDVLITVDPSGVDFSQPGLTGVAWFTEMAQGSRHGVYAVPDGTSEVCRPVIDFLQKPSAAEASAAGAVDRLGRVAVDTGILSFDPSLCRALLAFARRNRRWLATAPCLDVYEHFTYALVGKGEGRLERAFRGTPFHVNVLPFCEFFHMGSSRELLQCVTGASPTAAAHEFRNGVCADAPGSQAFAFNCCTDAPIRGRGGLVEGCWLAVGARLGGANILTGVPRACSVQICLPKETGLVCLPIGEKDWTAVAYRLDDNFKADGKWERPLWHVGAIDDAVAHALGTLRPAAGAVRRTRRLQSLAALVPRVNHARLLAARSEIFREVTRRHVAEEVSRSVTLPTAPRPAAILPDQVVWVTSPVRIDFAGGWSDTPPICLEQGGTVLNAAVTLNGQYPVQVMAKLTSARRIRISSIDLGDSRTFTSAAELQDHSDPHDWCAIAKAALVLTGVVPSQRGASRNCGRRTRPHDLLRAPEGKRHGDEFRSRGGRAGLPRPRAGRPFRRRPAHPHDLRAGTAHADGRGMAGPDRRTPSRREADYHATRGGPDADDPFRAVRHEGDAGHLFALLPLLHGAEAHGAQHPQQRREPLCVACGRDSRPCLRAQARGVRRGGLPVPA